MPFTRRRRRSLWRTVRDAWEDFIWRPVFFFTVLPPLVVYWRLDEAKALYRAKEHLQHIKRAFRTGKGLEEYFRNAWREQQKELQRKYSRFTTTVNDHIMVPPSIKTVEEFKTKLTDVVLGTTPNAVWEEHLEEPETPEANIPETFYEAVNLLDDLIDDEEDRKLFRETSVSEVEARYHHTLGRYLRNEWRLWEDGTPLRTWFLSMDVEHADDMSGMLISAWWHQLNGMEFDLIGRIELAKAYWRAVKPVMEAKPGEVVHVTIPRPLGFVNMNLSGTVFPVEPPDGFKDDDEQN